MDKVFVKYTNKLYFNGRDLSFKNKQLFDITGIPFKIEMVNNSGVLGWYVNKKFLSLNYTKTLVSMNEVEKEITSLQWYKQIDLINP
jgi:hypothetical protein